MADYANKCYECGKPMTWIGVIRPSGAAYETLRMSFCDDCKSRSEKTKSIEWQRCVMWHRLPDPFMPEPEQIAAFARWLRSREIRRKIADAMPLVGGPRSACEQRVEDVATALLTLVYGAPLGNAIERVNKAAAEREPAIMTNTAASFVLHNQLCNNYGSSDLERVLIDRLLWLRNHYEVSRGRGKTAILADIDEVLESAIAGRVQIPAPG